MDSLIRFRDVCFSYTPTRPVLDGACFDLRAGERVGLIGTNGCGKTTLLHLIVGLLQPCGGEIVAFGSARQRERDFLEVRRRAGLLFQDADDQLFCPTVAEDVAFGPVNLGYDREQIHAVVHETLAWLGMDGFEDRITYELSAGEKRLVALATVLAMRPEALLLDEPSANLDARARRRLVESLDARDEAMLVASHDLELMSRVCGRVICLSEGRIATFDSADTFLSDPRLLAEYGVG